MKAFGEFLLWLGTEGRAEKIILSPEDFWYLWERTPPGCLGGGRIWISNRCIEMTTPVQATLDVSDRKLFDQ